MRPADLQTLRARLLQRRAELVAEGDVPIDLGGGEVVSKPDEDAAPLEEMTQVIASGRNRARTAALRAIDDALRRLAQEPDDFGLCPECDEPIPQERLILMPEVTLCAECQRAEEARNPRGSSRRHLTDYR